MHRRNFLAAGALPASTGVPVARAEALHWGPVIKSAGVKLD